MKRVFLDAGHGGKDPGGTGNGLKEKDIALSVTMKIGNILKKHGVIVEYSRTSDEIISLGERSSMANRFLADLFISIHTNAFSNASVSGLEVYSYHFSEAGKILSKDIYESMIKDRIFTQKRGIKTANFAVLKNTKMPAVLVELGFISNPNDASILKDKQDDLAIAVAKGILKNLGIKYIEIDSKDKMYRVQVGVFKTKENAESLVKELESKGYKPIIV